MALWRRRPVEEQVQADAEPMPSIFERPPPPPAPLATLGELIPPAWRLREVGGALLGERLRFLPDGRIAGSPTPRLTWTMADGRITIGPLGEPPVWVFDRREKLARRDAILGISTGNDRQIALTPNVDDLQSMYLLQRTSEPLLIVFNSYANRLEEPCGHSEFSEWMQDGLIDLVLFNERPDPPFWYLNKTNRVLDRLRHLPAAGYREFQFLGQSSGGFAAMMYAELLSYEFPECRIRSVTIAAQTTHGAEHEAAIREAAAPEMLPLFIEADALSQKDCPVSGLRELVRMSTRRRGDQIEHRVLYDEANLAQAYYAHPLDDLPGFGLVPATIGLPHDEAIATMARSDAFRAAFEWGREQ